MARNPTDDLANVVKDAAYVSVGLSVLALQRIQVRRNELTKAMSGPIEETKGTLELLGALVGERVKLVEERVSAALGR